MVYNSVFDFLKEDNGLNEIYRDCLSMEREMSFESFDMSFVKGRTICEKFIKKIAKNNSKVSYLFSRKKPNGKPFIPGLSETLHACRNKKIIPPDIINKIYKIKNVGDAAAHGENIDKYNLNYSKKVHKMVFDIAVECYGEINYPINVHYFYSLKKYNMESSSDDRQEELNNLHMTEVAPDNTKEYYKFKKIFLTKDSFIKCISKYMDKLKNKNEFLMKLEKLNFINDENINDVLSNFERELRTKIKEDVEKTSHEKAEKIIETLNEFSADLTFKELGEIIVSTDDDDKREIYSLIKELSFNISQNYLNRTKGELEKVPVSYIDENGRKIFKHEKYDLKANENGCCLRIHLDEDQKSAVRYNGNKPLVIDAGPGSGKTRILVERVVYLIKELDIDPSTILLITFTNKAAQELKNRLINDAQLPNEMVNKIKVDTIYGLCRYLIAMYEPIPPIYMYNYDEQNLFISKFKKELGFENYAFLYDNLIPRVLEKYREFFNFRVDTEALSDYIKSKMEDNRIVSRYEKYIDDFHERYGDNQFPDFNYLMSNKIKKGYYYHIFLNIASSYPKYKELLKRNNVCDIDSTIEKGYEILTKYCVTNNLKYKHILIDEFHDIDYHQMEIFKILEKSSETFTVVGDSDQSIYEWRGYSSSFFEDCIRDPNFQHITIHNNYRSSGNIVEFNEELIREYRQTKKECVPVRSEGNPVFYLSNQESEEAHNVIQIIKNLKKDKKIKFYSDVALLFGSNRDMERFIELFEEYDVPYYTLTKRHDFLNQTEIKSMLTLFWLIMPYNKDKFFYRNDEFLNLSWLSNEYFGLSKETQDILNDIQINFEKETVKYAREGVRLYNTRIKNLTYSDLFNQEERIVNYVLDNIETFDLLSLTSYELIELGIADENDLEFFSKLRKIKSIMWDNNIPNSEKPDLLDIFYKLLNITDYFKEVSVRNDEKSIQIKDNLALFSRIIDNYGRIIGNDYLGLFDYLNRFLDNYSCPKRDANESFDKVHIMTMHLAKGLEYPVVISCSLKDRMFYIKKSFEIPPHIMGKDPFSVKKSQYKEEMRLLYVAFTRARDLLILSSFTSNNQLPAFLESLLTRNVKFKSLQPNNLNDIQEISSSVIKKSENVKTLNFEEILLDYLFCPHRYDILNNAHYSVSMDNQRDVESILDQFRNYKIEYLKNYDVLKSKVFVRKHVKNCEIQGMVDLIVKESDNEISIVQFIDYENKIVNFLDEYIKYQFFYTSVIKNHKEFKGYRIKNIILHSIDTDNQYVIPYQNKFEEEVLDSLENIANNILAEKFEKKLFKCSKCECKGKLC